MPCRWEDDEPCTSSTNCGFADMPRMLVPYVCARLTEKDREIRRRVFKELSDEV